jgi:hypothetical protein
MPPAYVKPYVKRQKNDATDAEAICEAVTRANMTGFALAEWLRRTADRIASISNQECPMSLLLALSVIRGDAPFCPLSDNSGQSQISVGDGLSAFDPKRTFSLSGISDLFL